MAMTATVPLERPFPKVLPADLRILAVIPGAPSGASMIFARRELNAIRKVGVDVRSFFLRVSVSPVAVVRELRRLQAAIRRFRPDVVHAHFGTMTAFLCVSASDVPVVVTFRGSDLNPNPSISRLRSWFGHALSHVAASRAARIICVSEQLRDRLCWGAARVSVLPSGVDTEKFVPMPVEFARKQLRWPESDRIVLFNAGANPRVKGLKLVQEAVAHARKRVGGLRLVTLDGRVDPDEVPLYFAAADCLALASEWEGSPTVVQEAMACNLPVVTVKVGDVVERLARVRPTRLVARNAKHFGDAIAEIVSLRHRSNGRAHLGICDLSELAPLVVDVYTQAARGNLASAGTYCFEKVGI